jgi:hypothetical protein
MTWWCSNDDAQWSPIRCIHPTFLSTPTSLKYSCVSITVVVALVTRVSAYPRFYFSTMIISSPPAAATETAAHAYWISCAVSLFRSTILTPGLEFKAYNSENPEAFICFPSVAFAFQKEHNPRVWRVTGAALYTLALADSFVNGYK